MAYLHARWQISVMSAPEKPLVCFTSRSSCAFQQHTSVVLSDSSVRATTETQLRACPCD